MHRRIAMGDQSSYYKITDTETLTKIDAFMEKRDEFYKKVKALCDHFGFERHLTHESIQNGIRFINMSVHPKDDVIDKNLWKTSKHRSGYLNVLPRATAKEHKAEYEAMLPKSMSYDELSKLILNIDVMPWSKAYGYKYKKGEFFMFETSLKVASVATEILGSEYHKKDLSEQLEGV